MTPAITIVVDRNDTHAGYVVRIAGKLVGSFDHAHDAVTFGKGARKGLLTAGIPVTYREYNLPNVEFIEATHYGFNQ